MIKKVSTCDDDDGPAENVGEDEDVNVLQRVKLEAVATGDRRRHLHNLFPLLLPVLRQHTHRELGYEHVDYKHLFAEDISKYCST